MYNCFAYSFILEAYEYVCIKLLEILGLGEQKTFLGHCTANYVFNILTLIILMCCSTLEDMAVEINFIANYAAVNGHLHSVSCWGLRATPPFISKGYKEEPAVCVG